MAVHQAGDSPGNYHRGRCGAEPVDPGDFLAARTQSPAELYPAGHRQSDLSVDSGGELWADAKTETTGEREVTTENTENTKGIYPPRALKTPNYFSHRDH